MKRKDEGGEEGEEGNDEVEGGVLERSGEKNDGRVGIAEVYQRNGRMEVVLRSLNQSYFIQNG